MSLRDSLVLRVTALWTVFVWVVFVRNILADKHHSNGFKAVHVLLAVVSVVLAFLIWSVASRNRRDHRHRPTPGTNRPVDAA